MDVDEARLRATIEELTTYERPSASPGEQRAAEWIVARLRELGGRNARVEAEPAHGTYWVPIGLLAGAGALAGVLGGRVTGWPGRVVLGALGAAAAAGIVDDVSGGRHWARRALPHRETYNAVAEFGDPAAERTVVLVAHHDAAHGGAIFDDRAVWWIADRFPDWFAKQETSPQIMALVAAGPLLAGIGALTGLTGVRRLGTTVSLGSVAAFADIARSPVVPGANDNLTAVAMLLELARALQREPVEGLRVILLSTGSEESFMEGMRGFVARHRGELPTDTTHFICADSVGSPELILIEGEGMVRMRDYPSDFRELVAGAAARIGVKLRRGLRLGLATDGLISMKAGYPTATLGSVTRIKFPSNYHKPTDTADRVDYGTVADAARLCEAVVRELAATPAA